MIIYFHFQLYIPPPRCQANLSIFRENFDFVNFKSKRKRFGIFFRLLFSI